MEGIPSLCHLLDSSFPRTRESRFGLRPISLIGVGERLSPSPPSEPCVRFSRTRLSSRWFPHRDWLANTGIAIMVNNPCARKSISYLPLMTPLTSAANMRSLHFEASTHDQSRPRVSALCVVLSDTGNALLSLYLCVEFTYPPSCLPSLGAVLLPALFAAFGRCGTMKALTPAQLTYHAGLPAYLATPSCRSVSNHVDCLNIAYHHASVSSGFRTSPWNRRLVAAPPPNRVRFTTDRLFASGCSPPRFTATQLPSTSEFVAYSDTDFHRADVAPSRAHDSRFRGYDRTKVTSSL